MVLMCDSLRVGRLTGDCPKDEAYTLGKVTDQVTTRPQKVHELFKDQDAFENRLREAELLKVQLLTSKLVIFLRPHSVAPAALQTSRSTRPPFGVGD